MIPEEVDMPPGGFLEVMGLAGIAALGPVVEGAANGLDVEAEFARIGLQVQHMSHHLPGIDKFKAEAEQILCIQSRLLSVGDHQLTPLRHCSQ